MSDATVVIHRRHHSNLITEQEHPPPHQFAEPACAMLALDTNSSAGAGSASDSPPVRGS